MVLYFYTYFSSSPSPPKKKNDERNGDRYTPKDFRGRDGSNETAIQFREDAKRDLERDGILSGVSLYAPIDLHLLDTNFSLFDDPDRVLGIHRTIDDLVLQIVRHLPGQRRNRTGQLGQRHHHGVVGESLDSLLLRRHAHPEKRGAGLDQGDGPAATQVSLSILDHRGAERDGRDSHPKSLVRIHLFRCLHDGTHTRVWYLESVERSVEKEHWIHLGYRRGSESLPRLHDVRATSLGAPSLHPGVFLFRPDRVPVLCVLLLSLHGCFQDGRHPRVRFLFVDQFCVISSEGLLAVREGYQEIQSQLFFRHAKNKKLKL